MPFDPDAAERYATPCLGHGRLERLIVATAPAPGIQLVIGSEVDAFAIPGLLLENWTR